MAWFGNEPADVSTASNVSAGTTIAQESDFSCSACGIAAAAHCCSRCGVRYCSPECQRAAWKEHKAVCRRPADAVAVPSTSSAAPAVSIQQLDLRTELTSPLHSSNWQEYFAEKGVTGKAEVERVKEREAFGLAVLQALQHLPKDMRLEATNGRCVTWVLGARDGIEKRQILVGGWEPLFSALDVAWDIALVGPELQGDTRQFIAPGRKIYTFSCLAHEADMPEGLRKPSFICALNTGIGANVVHHMRSWIPTLQQLLLLGIPVLFTCFGPHEARVEAQVFAALQARHAPHREGGFSYIVEPDKPLSVCNAMFTWVCGTRLTSSQLNQQAAPYVDAQLRSCELFHFLKEARSHVNILADPEHAAHSSWAEMYDGRFIPCLKQALEEDDDDRGGIQTILRCSMKTVASASHNPLAAAVLLDLGMDAALASFKPWAQTAQWTRHDWILEEVLERVEETELRLTGAASAATDVDEVEPFFCSYLVRVKQANILSEPRQGARVTARVSSGKTLTTRAHKGLWLQVTCADFDGWLLGYQDKRNTGDMTSWDILGCDVS